MIRTMWKRTGPGLTLALTFVCCSAPEPRREIGPDAVVRAEGPVSTRQPGPAVGDRIPPFELPDQDGRKRSLASLSGPNGLVLNFNRSAVW